MRRTPLTPRSPTKAASAPRTLPYEPLLGAQLPKTFPGPAGSVIQLTEAQYLDLKSLVAAMVKWQLMQPQPDTPVN